MVVRFQDLENPIWAAKYEEVDGKLSIYVKLPKEVAEHIEKEAQKFVGNDKIKLFSRGENYASYDDASIGCKLYPDGNENVKIALEAFKSAKYLRILDMAMTIKEYTYKSKVGFQKSIVDVKLAARSATNWLAADDTFEEVSEDMTMTAESIATMPSEPTELDKEKQAEEAGDDLPF